VVTIDNNYKLVEISVRSGDFPQKSLIVISRTCIAAGTLRKSSREDIGKIERKIYKFTTKMAEKQIANPP
jgi:hypothetical protein